MAIGNAVNAAQTGFQSLTAGGVWNGRTLTAGGGVSITNGDGTAGNPTISSTASSSSFYAFKSANTANVTGNNTNAIVVYDTEVLDAGGNYNNATGIYTVPATGVYAFSASVGFSSLTATATRGNVIFFINGGTTQAGNTQLNVGVVRDTGNAASFSISCIVQLTVGDTFNVEVNVTGVGANTVGLVGNGVRTYSFGGFQIA